MTGHRTEEEVEKMIEDMSRRAKGDYITQGVSFNKNCPRQRELLKKALMSSVSFSGLIKELLATKIDEEQKQQAFSGSQVTNEHIGSEPTIKNVGNFI